MTNAMKDLSSIIVQAKEVDVSGVRASSLSLSHKVVEELSLTNDNNQVMIVFEYICNSLDELEDISWQRRTMIAWNKNTIDNYVDSDSYSGDRIVMTILSSTIPRVDIPTT